jgi:deoxyribonuclease IV
VVNDARFGSIPLIMETPKGTEDGEELDAINLRTLRGLERDAVSEG